MELNPFHFLVRNKRDVKTLKCLSVFIEQPHHSVEWMELYPREKVEQGRDAYAFREAWMSRLSCTQGLELNETNYIWKNNIRQPSTGIRFIIQMLLNRRISNQWQEQFGNPNIRVNTGPIAHRKILVSVVCRCCCCCFIILTVPLFVKSQMKSIWKCSSRLLQGKRLETHCLTVQTQMKLFLLPCRCMRTGGRASQITSLREGRTAWWPLPMRTASGTTCPATTTCPTSARKAQVLRHCCTSQPKHARGASEQ